MRRKLGGSTTGPPIIDPGGGGIFIVSPPNPDGSVPVLGTPTSGGVLNSGAFITFTINGGPNKGSIGNGSFPIGLKYDPLGKSNYGADDYIRPGTPWEAYGFRINESYYVGGANSSDLTDSNSFPITAIWDKSTPTYSYQICQRGTPALGFTQAHYISYKAEPIIRMKMTYTNHTGASVTAKAFRAVDPDIDVDVYGTYVTNNVRGWPTPSVPQTDLVNALGSYSLKPLSLYASGDGYTHNTAIIAGWPQDDPDIWLSGRNDGNGDYSIGIGWNIGTVPNGSTVSIYCYYLCGTNIDDILKILELGKSPDLPSPPTNASIQNVNGNAYVSYIAGALTLQNIIILYSNSTNTNINGIPVASNIVAANVLNTTFNLTDTAYYYSSVTSSNLIGYSSVATTNAIYIIPITPVPSANIEENSSSAAYVSYTASPSATSYIIKLYNTGGLIDTQTTSLLNYTFTITSPGFYYATVVSSNSSGLSSAVQTNTIEIALLLAIASGIIENLSGNAYVSFTPTLNDRATSYYTILYSNAVNTNVGGINIDSYNVYYGSNISFIIPGTAYYYASIQSSNLIGLSPTFTTTPIEISPIPIVPGSVNNFSYIAEYIVISFQFSDGKDLDIRVRVNSPYIGAYSGYGKPNSDPTLFWSGDNLRTGFESCYFDIGKFRNSNIGPNVQIECRSMWFQTVGIQPVKLVCTFYKGGAMILNNYIWTNPTATDSLILDSDNFTITLLSTTGDGQYMATLHYNTNTGNGYMSY